MMSGTRVMLTGFLLFVTLVSGTVRADPFVLDVLETDELRLLYFDPLQTYLVPHVGRSFHNSIAFQRNILNWAPWEKTTVMLTDFSDYANAAAGVVPHNSIQLDVAPLNRIFETFSASERVYMMMNHELVHVATMDGWNEQDRRWRRFFLGKPTPEQVHPESILYFYLTAPRAVAPRWYTEGSAVFMETWMAGGIGRAQGAYDEMVFRSMVRDDAHFYSNLGLVSEGTLVDFQVGVNAYLYGTRFFSYMAYQYSPEQVIEWLKRDEDSERYYASQFRKVFSKTLEDAWDDWIAFEHEFQEKNLEAVRQHPLTASEPLTEQGVGSISRAFIDTARNSMIAAFRYPGVVAHIGEFSLDERTTRRITDIKGPMLFNVTSLAFDESNRTLFFTTDNNAFRDLMSVNADKSKPRMLMKDARIGDLVFDKSTQSLLGLRHQNGFVTLVKIPPPYEVWEQVHTWPYGEVLYDIDISPNGKLLSASMGEVNGNQYLRVFPLDDLANGKSEPMLQFDFGTFVPEGFVFSQDGRFLYGSSYYTGISNIFRYEIATADIQAVSNAETGFFRPVPMDDGRLMVFEYTGQGFKPTIIDPVPLEDLSAIKFLGAEIVKKHPVVKDWAVGSPADVPLDDLVSHRGKYSPTHELDLSSGYPVIEGYRDSVALGYNLSWSDPMLFNRLTTTLSHSLDSSLSSSETLHADIEYRKFNWRFHYWHNTADFYDLSGPTERSRKGDAFIVGYEKALIFDKPRRMDLDVSVAHYTGLDTLPNNQNVATSFTKLSSANIDLSYSHTRKSLGSVDHEKGFRWDVASYADYVGSDFISKFRAGLDFGFALPLKHSSLWFYNSAGRSSGDRNNAFANWFFGSYGNNYVDDGEVKRYRDFDSFPGFDIDQLSGQDFGKSIIEWNLPPVTFKEVGIPAFYLSWMRTALFAGTLVTDIGSGTFDKTYNSLGIQTDLHFTIVHRLPMTLSVGFAQGYVGSNKFDNEWMVSLKIL
ncbi:MAG: hypothetical protein OER80_03070 [Gammaproteobacteria bacterium]|nr:hypothetical protein [Gammaproteobacteria bacterium]